MEQRYNVYFAGQVKPGADPASVREQLAKAFNANQATLDKLFSGTPQLIKRECDLATAQKFQAALDRAGAIPIVRPADATPAESGPVASKTAAPPAMTKAERIAALAAAPDEVRFRQQSSAAAATSTSNVPVEDNGGIVLAPPGTAVLRQDERAKPVVREVDTSSLTLDDSGQRLSAEAGPVPGAPDTSHLSMGEVGETIPTLPSTAMPLSPNLDGLALSAAGTDFSDCATPAPEPPALDLSTFTALPPGAPTAAEQQREPIPVAVPSTDHISIKE